MGLVICNPTEATKWDIYCIGCRVGLGQFDSHEISEVCRTFDQGVFCDCCADHRRVLRFDGMLATVRAYTRRHSEMVEKDTQPGLEDHEEDTEPHSLV